MIHIFIGTKAQFIKMMPIMQVLKRRNIAYNCIDAGQHGGITDGLVEQFLLRKPDVYLQNKPETISTITSALKWSMKILGKLIIQPNRAFKGVFKGQRGICLIHGDTLTTLISLLYAKRCGIKVAHVEAGLRSFKYLDPFPEEIIRLIAMRLSDILFAPSASAFKNLCKMGYGKKTINIKANTGQDAVAFAIQQHDSSVPYENSSAGYVVVTIHRLETLFSKSRMEFIVNAILNIAHSFDVIFVLHEPTLNQLKKYKLLKRMQRGHIKLRPLQSYIHFIKLLARASFVITDGGSVQEECFFLNKPCLIMRSKTERQEGLGENALLSKFDCKRVNTFVDRYIEFKRTQDLTTDHPSESIIDQLVS